MTGSLTALLAALTLVLAVPRRSRPRAAHLVADGRLRSVAEIPRGSGTALRLQPKALFGAVAAVTIGLLAWTTGPLLGAAAAVVAALAALLVRDIAARRRAATRRAAVAAAVRILVGELEAGARPADALEASAVAAPALATALAAAARAAAAGEEPGAVLAQHGAAEDGDPTLRTIGVAWQVSASTGAALATVLRRIGTDLADADEQRRTVATVLAGPRSSALVLAGLPALGVALGGGMGAHPLHFLFAVPAGRLLCCVGVVLDAAGIWWLRALLRRAEQP